MLFQHRSLQLLQKLLLRPADVARPRSRRPAAWAHQPQVRLLGETAPGTRPTTRAAILTTCSESPAVTPLNRGRLLVVRSPGCGSCWPHSTVPTTPWAHAGNRAPLPIKGPSVGSPSSLVPQRASNRFQNAFEARSCRHHRRGVVACLVGPSGLDGPAYERRSQPLSPFSSKIVASPSVSLIESPPLAGHRRLPVIVLVEPAEAIRGRPRAT